MRSHILVIEEDPDLSRLFDSMLRLEGHEVALVRNVQEAQDKIAEREPDLIIFDWQLSNAAGFMCVDMMRNDERTAHIPIMLVCGARPPRSVYEMLSLAGVPMLEKPFDLMVFCRHVAALLHPIGRTVGAT